VIRDIDRKKLSAFISSGELVLKTIDYNRDLPDGFGKVVDNGIAQAHKQVSDFVFRRYVNW
jgi:hypothetical protein